MKALVLNDIGSVVVHSVPDPLPEPDEALIRVEGTGICGSDMAGFLGHSSRRKPPLIMGHEVVGTIASMPRTPPTAGKPWPFAAGDRVVANPLITCGECAACRAGRSNICSNWRLLGMDATPGAFADLVVVPARNIFPVPVDLPCSRAVMVEPLANSVHLLQLISRHAPANLALFGAGTQGCLLIALARTLGYQEILVTDVNPARLAVAKRLGARHTVDVRTTEPVSAIRDAFGAEGADVVIDARGDTQTRSACVHAARRGGDVLLLGLHQTESSVDFSVIVRNELRLQGSFAYTTEDFARSHDMTVRGAIDLSAWTEAFPLAEGQSAFDRLASDAGATLKIYLTV